MTRSLDEPIREFTYAELWESGRESKIVGQWQLGRLYRQQGRAVENRWRPGHELHTAFAQGFAGQPLDVGDDHDQCLLPLGEGGRRPDEGRQAIDVHPKAESSERGPSPQPSPNGRGSNHGPLVAFDFMNLLVRCFHVGQPSDFHGVRGMLLTVSKVIRTLKPRRIVFAAEGGHAHRTKLLATYKAHRPQKPPELIAQIELAERALEALGWPLIRVTDFEADDVLASIVARSLRDRDSCESLSDSPTVIVSTDKDLLQLLPRCGVWNPFGDAGGWQTHATVAAKFGCQLHQLGDWLALVGDASDGIPGANGIGDKTATKLLAEFGDIETAVAQAAVGNVSGALGKKLKSAEFLQQVELSRKLLALVETLDVGESLRDSHSNAGHGVTGLRAGWQQRLQELRLFAAIKPLTEAIESLSGREEVSDLAVGAPTVTRPPRAVAKSLF